MVSVRLELDDVPDEVIEYRLDVSKSAALATASRHPTVSAANPTSGRQSRALVR